MAVGKEIPIADAFLKMPTMANPAFHIKEVGVCTSGTGNQSVASIGLLWRVVD